MTGERPEQHFHGPENAEHELKKAYNLVIEAGVTYDWDRHPPADMPPHDEVAQLYRQAFDAFSSGDRLVAERLARATKHLARAFWHEAKIAYLLQPRTGALPALGQASAEYNLHETPQGSAELLDSLTHAVSRGGAPMAPEAMSRYLLRGRQHLLALQGPIPSHDELLRAEHIKASHEYGRVVECLLLAQEAASPPPIPKAA